MDESYPSWWQGIETPPPAEWVYVFEDFTGEDTAEQWALAAAICIAQTRRRTMAGPTFAELFTYLLPDTNGLPGPMPEGLEFHERRQAVAGFRGYAAIEWRRRGMISFDNGVMRSLRVGREFRERSRSRQLARSAEMGRQNAQRSSDVDNGTGAGSHYPPEIQRIVDRIAAGWPELVDVGAGWYPLLASLDAKLAVVAPGYVVHQVKAKFGSLCFYAQPSANPTSYNDRFNELIRQAEWDSIVTCERCGEPARQYTIKLWTWTLCAAHAAAQPE
jgi:hypothetical protein